MKELLTKPEAEWLNGYHEWVYNTLEKHLNQEEKTWLREKTRAI